jgi:hypothetical protein
MSAGTLRPACAGSDWFDLVVPGSPSCARNIKSLQPCTGRAPSVAVSGEEILARRTFFSFHYQPDVWRAWNVRNCSVVRDDDQVEQGFFDSSVFEKAKKESDDTLKNFLREGLKYTSITCVLAGTATWTRRWVKYEIARSVLKGNGLLTVDVDGVENSNKEISKKGANPLDAMGVYKTDAGIYLAEWQDAKWVKYNDYTLAIPEGDLWFDAPTSNSVVQLSRYCKRYDFVAHNGRQNIDDWIEEAAVLAGW